MTAIIDIVLQSGKSAVELALYVLLPIMVVMLAPIRLLKEKGALEFLKKLLTPLCRPFGMPGIGVLAVLQSILVSFAAPVATLKIMELDKEIPIRQIAATLAMVLTVSQANVVFPLISVGLNPWLTLATSLVGGMSASALTYYYFSRFTEEHAIKSIRNKVDEGTVDNTFDEDTADKNVVSILLDGGQEGVDIALRSIPVLVVAFCFVNVLKAIGFTTRAESLLSPMLNWVHLPGIAIQPLLTKYVAGGTAMMGITIPLVRDGLITPLELNRMAGLGMNPLDIVGVAVLMTAGSRVRSGILPALEGAAVGIMIRSALHFLIF